MSLERLEEHRRLWAAKPLLQDVYRVWFDALTAALPARARVLEVGAGPGFLAAHARERRPDLQWIASDILPAPWNDLAADGLRQPFGPGSFQALVGLDFIHHLARPERLFTEAARVLAPGGALVAVEPWVTPFSYPVYRWLHPEGCRLGLDPWNPFGADVGEAKDAFDGDGAVVWKLIRTTPAARWAALGLEPPETTLVNGFAYLASLGFRPAALVPRGVGRVLMSLDRALRPLAGALGLRVLVRWRRKA
jgi:SAM-dependent methyltransferase